MAAGGTGGNSSGDHSQIAQLGLTPHHTQQLTAFVQFTRHQKRQHLKTVDAVFSDALHSWLGELTYTRDEVAELVTRLATHVHAELEAELQHVAATCSLQLRQLLVQAQRWQLPMQLHCQQLEDGDLIDKVKQFSKQCACDANSSSTQGDAEQPVPVDMEALQQLARLTEENQRLSDKLSQIEVQASQLADEKDDLSGQLLETGRKMSDARDLQTLSATRKIEQLTEETDQIQRDLTCDLQRVELDRSQLSEQLHTSRQQLLQLQSHLQLAENELERKFQQTAAYRNLRRILDEKNERIRQLQRELISQPHHHPPHDHPPHDDDNDDVQLSA